MSDYMQGDPDKNAVVVPFSDDDAANDNAAEAPKPNESPEERRTRKQRQQDRLQALLRDGEEAKKKLAEVEERDARRERELAELRGQLTAIQQMKQAANDSGKDPYQARLDAIYDRQREAYANAQAEIAAGKFDDKRQRYYETVAREIEEEKVRVHTERVIAAREPERQAQQAAATWVAKYPDVYRDPRAYAYAEATFRQRQALGEQATNELVDSIMEETLAKFRLGGRKAAPSASDKARLSGVAASGAGGGSGAPGVQLTPQLRQIALAAYSDLPEAEAIKKWVNGPGKRLRDKKAL